MSPAGEPASAAVRPAENLNERIAGFVRRASMEITPADEKRLPELAALLPKAAIYIAHPPNSTFNNVLNTALVAQRAGFTAVPHIVARRINYPHTLRTALAALRTGGVENVLLVAGDGPRVAGEFASTLDVLNSGILEESGISRVDVAGYPEGQKSVGAGPLWDALTAKYAYAARTGVWSSPCTRPKKRSIDHTDWAPAFFHRDRQGLRSETPLPRHDPLPSFHVQCRSKHRQCQRTLIVRAVHRS